MQHNNSLQFCDSAIKIIARFHTKVCTMFLKTQNVLLKFLMCWGKYEIRFEIKKTNLCRKRYFLTTSEWLLPPMLLRKIVYITKSLVCVLHFDQMTSIKFKLITFDNGISISEWNESERNGNKKGTTVNSGFLCCGEWVNVPEPCKVSETSRRDCHAIRWTERFVGYIHLRSHPWELKPVCGFFLWEGEEKGTWTTCVSLL